MGQLEGMEVVVMEVEGEKEEVEESGSEERVRWEEFMPKMVLRVLLVEADDPTRQIIAALLRKYNYKVAAISDGLKAWEILKRRHSSIDLILTELDLPSISGYALLTLIMEHDGCKDIPVIIMSSQDSVSMVLKCFLKGAADYLIKPVRKNELKNLWRHVWKRLYNNAGNNPQSLTAAQPKTEAKVEDDPTNKHPKDNVSSSWKCGENDTNSQNLGTLRCMEDSQGLTLMKHREENGVSHREEEHEVKNVKLEETEDKTDQLGSGAQPSKEVNVPTGVRVEEDGSCTGIATADRSAVPENHMFRANTVGREPLTEAADLIGRINMQKGAARQASSRGEFNGHNYNPELDLSLKSSLDSETEEVHERHILNHSNASAFSWYSSSKKPRTTFFSSDGELLNIKGVADSPIWQKPFDNSRESKCCSVVPQTGDCHPASPHHQFGLVPLPGFAVDNGVWASYGAMLQPTISSQEGPTARSPNSALQREESPLVTSPSLHSDPGTHSSTQGCGQAEAEPKMTESVERPGYCSSNVVDPSSSGTQCNDFGSQNKLSAHGSASDTTEVNTTAFGLKGSSLIVERPGYCSSNVVDPSSSGTQCNDFGSQNKLSAHGSASDITEVNTTASGLKGSSLTDESENCKPLVHDQVRSTMGLHSAEREAALAKFRQKRKGRCFEKKVRYQSRKKLAEQRPRVKGQFVRQAPSDRALVDNKPQI